MKFVIALCVVLSLALSDQDVYLSQEQSADIKEYYHKCIEETHVDKELVEKARKGDFAENEALDNFFTCFFKKCDFLDDEGHINTDAIKKELPPGVSEEIADKLFQTCKKIESEPKSKISLLAYKCFLTEFPFKVHII